MVYHKIKWFTGIYRMVKMEESLSMTSSGIQVSTHGIPQDKMVYWNIPYGEDGRKPVHDLLWYPGEHPWYITGQNGLLVYHLVKMEESLSRTSPWYPGEDPWYIT
jgi:hypothetical protein